MKKNLLTNLKFIAFGIVVAYAMNYVSASAWINPPANPPINNTDQPVNVSATDQVKGDPASGTGGGLSVLGFVAGQNAQFEKGVFVGGIIRGDSPFAPTTSSTVRFGGATGLGTTRTVNLAMNGSLDTKVSVSASNLANVSSKEVCADANGNLVFCTTTPPPAACSITSFTATPSTITTTPASTNLQWATTNCTSVTIDGALQASPNGNDNFSVNASHTYTLVATNTTSTDTATAQVTYNPPASNCPVGQVELADLTAYGAGYICGTPGIKIGVAGNNGCGPWGNCYNPTYVNVRTGVSVILNAPVVSDTVFTIKWTSRVGTSNIPMQENFTILAGQIHYGGIMASQLWPASGFETSTPYTSGVVDRSGVYRAGTIFGGADDFGFPLANIDNAACLVASPGVNLAASNIPVCQ